LRAVAGMAAMDYGITRLGAGPPIGQVIRAVLGIAAGILLVTGLWTPLSGSLVAVLGLWNVASGQPFDTWANILLATIGASLALVGPGAWSLDARLFGWKRIDVRDRTT
jgi:putative oxidoreductase